MARRRLGGPCLHPLCARSARHDRDLRHRYGQRRVVADRADRGGRLTHPLRKGRIPRYRRKGTGEIMADFPTPGFTGSPLVRIDIERDNLPYFDAAVVNPKSRLLRMEGLTPLVEEDGGLSW